jgi:hypothetical protein
MVTLEDQKLSEYPAQLEKNNRSQIAIQAGSPLLTYKLRRAPNLVTISPKRNNQQLLARK